MNALPKTSDFFSLALPSLALPSLALAGLLAIGLAAPASAEPPASGAGDSGALALLILLAPSAVPEEPFWEDEEAEDPALAIPSFVAPDLDKSIAYRERAQRQGLARPELPATLIRRGFAAQTSRPYAASESAVGVRLGEDQLSLATSLISGSGIWRNADTRVDWELARRSAGNEPGLLWGLATGGGIAMTGGSSQNASAVLGYRYSLFDNVTLTSEIALASSYAFAGHNMPEATLKPQVQVVADLSSTLSTPWKTVLDVKMNRDVPLSGGEHRGSATALMRFQFKLD